MTDGPAWRLRLTPAAARDLRRLDPPVRRRVLVALDRLVAADPRVDVRALAGRPESRLRVGSWRVVFTNDESERVILVRRVLPRGRAYDR